MKKILTAILIIAAVIALATYLGKRIYTQSGEDDYDTIQQFNVGALESRE